ncbi:hypothetical protein [Nocardia yamanashiensis]|uniref:hypothetical protein n=1 Tax=Nocardia yamanashiensis TaxID=209247 RepID=UPI000A9ADBF7|nr:hypothetical protein [Nocardia yamanashiensis]
MGGSRKPPGPGFAYGAALVIAAALIGGGAGLVAWFRTHEGGPPPIIVVAPGPETSTSPPVPTTRPAATATARPVVAPERIPPTGPDASAYTAAPGGAMPDFVNKSANHYGWFGGDGVSARCDEWNRATVVGSTVQTLFVVCGTYFKAYELASGAPIRTGIAGGGGSWTGAGEGISIRLTRDALTLERGGDPVVQPVVEWWQP